MRNIVVIITTFCLTLLAGCDTWGYKEGYSYIPYVSGEASISINEAKVGTVSDSIKQALSSVASNYNLEVIDRKNGMAFAIPDYENNELSRGTISIEREEVKGNTKVSLLLYQFSTVLPYGERVFDETIEKLQGEYGVVLTINRQP